MSKSLSIVAKPLRVLLVDDEELACLRLKHLLEECSQTPSVVVAQAHDADSALAHLSQHTIDLILLDVGLPGVNGTQFATSLMKQACVPAIIFVTAHAQHALQAFDLNAVDYLTKPVRSERLAMALQKVHQRLSQQDKLGVSQSSIVVNERGHVWRVPLHEVVYFKAELKYVTLRTPQRTHIVDDSLNDLAPRVGEYFIRIHRNALVSCKAITELERRLMSSDDSDEMLEHWAVRVQPVNEWLVVSRRHLSEVRAVLDRDKI